MANFSLFWRLGSCLFRVQFFSKIKLKTFGEGRQISLRWPPAIGPVNPARDVEEAPAV